MKKVATRFAPSPTGPLHIGGVRTALFNWLYSKNQNGKFYLRVEDTDKERSKDEYKNQIIKSLKWIGINYDGDEYIQSKKSEDHIRIAKELLKNGHAYKCYCSSEEIEDQKKRARQKKIPYIYDRKWRDKQDSDAPKGIKPVIRFKSKINGTTILKDLVQGDVEIDNNTIEDFIILRNDGTPTYNLSASVDDHLMDMTHIIRGDDHKINTFKQIQIYEAMKWELPSFAHIPLIHTIEGKKLSKRDKASTLDDYSKIGIMPDALRNYLLRLGWSHKDKEIFTLDESIKHFNLEGIGKSPSKLDMSRILSMNEYYIKNIDENNLFNQLIEYCKLFKIEIKQDKKDKIKKSLTFLKNKAKTLEDIYNNGQYIIVDKVNFNQDDIKLIDDKAKKDKNFHKGLNTTIPTEIKIFKFNKFNDVFKSTVDLIVLGISSKGIEWAADQLSNLYKGKQIPNLLMLTKGLSIHNNEYELLVDKLERLLSSKGSSRVNISAVGGPCLAAGLANRVHSSVVIANKDIHTAKKIADMLNTNYYHTSFSDDLNGVEVSAAIKNIFSMAVGAAKSLCSNNISEEVREKNYLNTASAIIKQSIHEMEIFVEHLKGRKETVKGLAGLGDLYVSSGGGRNAKMGAYIGQGLSFSEAKKTKMEKITVEGADLAKEIAKKVNEDFDEKKLPLMLGIINAIVEDKKLEFDWEAFR